MRPTHHNYSVNAQILAYAGDFLDRHAENGCLIHASTSPLQLAMNAAARMAKELGNPLLDVFDAERKAYDALNAITEKHHGMTAIELEESASAKELIKAIDSAIAAEQIFNA